ncbi:MAG: type IV toxin-antitoxin system AbiEi family antitoxin domain-containing protein [Candidatus Nanopelagicales bacterium]
MRKITPGLRDAAENQHGLVSMEQAIAAGAGRDAVRDDVLRGRALRLHRGVYSIPGFGESDPFRLDRAAQLHLGPSACLVLASAARLHGIQGPTGARVSQLAVPPGLEKRQRAGIELHFWKLPEDQCVVIDGLTATNVKRTLADCARLLPRMQGVSCLDSALELGLITRETVLDLSELMSRKRHCATGRRRLSEAREGAQSPLETRVRLRAMDGGFPPDTLQVAIRDTSGQLLGYGDIGYELPSGQWLIVEADGVRYHDQPEALLHDRRRQNAFLSSNVSALLRFTWQDTQRAGYIPSVLGTALAKTGWRPNPRQA